MQKDNSSIPKRIITGNTDLNDFESFLNQVQDNYGKTYMFLTCIYLLVCLSNLVKTIEQLSDNDYNKLFPFETKFYLSTPTEELDHPYNLNSDDALKELTLELKQLKKEIKNCNKNIDKELFITLKLERLILFGYKRELISHILTKHNYFILRDKEYKNILEYNLETNTIIPVMTNNTIRKIPLKSIVIPFDIKFTNPDELFQNFLNFYFLPPYFEKDNDLYKSSFSIFIRCMNINKLKLIDKNELFCFLAHLNQNIISMLFNNILKSCKITSTDNEKLLETELDGLARYLSFNQAEGTSQITRLELKKLNSDIKKREKKLKLKFDTNGFKKAIEKVLERHKNTDHGLFRLAILDNIYYCFLQLCTDKVVNNNIAMCLDIPVSPATKYPYSYKNYLPTYNTSERNNIPKDKILKYIELLSNYRSLAFLDLCNTDIGILITDKDNILEKVPIKLIDDKWTVINTDLPQGNSIIANVDSIKGNSKNKVTIKLNFHPLNVLNLSTAAAFTNNIMYDYDRYGLDFDMDNSLDRVEQAGIPCNISLDFEKDSFKQWNSETYSLLWMCIIRSLLQITENIFTEYAHTKEEQEEFLNKFLSNRNVFALSDPIKGLLLSGLSNRMQKTERNVYEYKNSKEGLLRLEPNPDLTDELDIEQEEIIKNDIEHQIAIKSRKELCIMLDDILDHFYFNLKERDSNDYITVSIDDILDFRKLKKSKGSYTREQIENHSEALKLLLSVYIEINTSNKKIFLKNKSGKDQKLESINGYLWETKSDQLNNGPIFMLKPGAAKQKLMHNNTIHLDIPMIVKLNQDIYTLDPYREGKEFRLIRYLEHLWRIRGRKGQLEDSLSINIIVNKLYTDNEVQKNANRPGVLIDSIERILDNLQLKGFISEWYYDSSYDQSKMTGKNKFNYWVNSKVIIYPPENISDYYEELRDKDAIIKNK